MQEIWKDIPNYEELYQISNLGRIKIKGNTKTKKEKIKKNTINKEGYYVIKLSKNNVKKLFLVHRLVAKAFLDENNFKFLKDDDLEKVKETYLTVNHKDYNKLNNCVDNLEWCTNRYNIKYGCKTKRKKKEEKKKEILQYIKNSNGIDEKVKKELIKQIVVF